MKFPRENELRISLFVDDFFLMVETLCAIEHKDFLSHTLSDLGWEVNFEKSKLQLSKACSFIGFEVSSDGPDGPWVKVMAKKLHKLKRDIRYALSRKHVTARFLAKIGGQCVAMTQAILPAKLLLRNLYRNLSYRDS